MPLYETSTRKEYTKRELCEALRSQMESERSTFVSHWREIQGYILPRRARFFITDVNKGDRRNQKIIDSTGTLAVRTLRSGMMGGVTSPARPWVRLTVSDPDLAENTNVKLWLHTITGRMIDIMLRSNLYNSLPILYADMAVYGTSAMLVEEDFDNVFRTYVFPIGSYMIANDDKLRVRVFFREFRMTVRQLIERFGIGNPNTGEFNWGNFSITIRDLYNRGMMEAWIDVCHVIKPNDNYDQRKLESKFKRYVSYYYEKGYGNQQVQFEKDDIFLRESGYDLFPVLCPRWEVTGEDVYGTSCPGMEALGDIKQLQVEQRRKAQAIEKGINPPMVGPTALKTAKVTILPGDITFTDEREGVKGFRAAHEINLNIQHLLIDIQDLRQIISRAFYEDLFLMLAHSNRREITATEVEERKEEKLFALGPVLEQLNQDLLDPLIDLIFNYMVNQGLVPEAPEELQGISLKIEYVSVMAQAQRLVGIGAIERFASFTANIAAQAGEPSVIDKVNIDQLIDEHGIAVGVPPTIIRSDEEVDEMRAQRAKEVQAQQQMKMVAEGAKVAKDLSKSDLEKNNALKRIVSQ